MRTTLMDKTLAGNPKMICLISPSFPHMANTPLVIKCKCLSFQAPGDDMQIKQLQCVPVFAPCKEKIISIQIKAGGGSLISRTELLLIRVNKNFIEFLKL